MSIWTLIGLAKGQASTRWPKPNGDDGQTGVVGMPRLQTSRCQQGCQDCANVCLTQAITIAPETQAITLDYGKCINCQLCVETCPTDAIQPSNHWAFGVAHRDDLCTTPHTESITKKAPTKIGTLKRRGFKRSLHILHVDAGSCNGCESEIHSVLSPYYNLERLGIFFTPSPRHADLLLVTGSVTYNTKEALLAAYEAMPEPRWVMAIGTCAVSGGSNGGGYACHQGVAPWLPVDFYLPGCAPNPAAIMSALLTFLERMPQKVQGGQLVTD